MTTIDSQYLRVFCSIARHLNMGRAAQELKLTPSAISHCLKSLETDLGCRLYDRTSRKISLTPAGAEFLADADSILQRMTSARSRLRSWGDWRRGRLRVAASTTACQHILPPALREFRESFRDFTIQIEPCTSQQALGALGEGRADLAVFVQPLHAPGMNFIAIAVDELHYLVNPLHPWVSKRKANSDEISKQNLILPERASETHALIEAYFRKEGIRIQPFIEIGSEEATKQFVRLDLGIGLLPKWIAAAELQQGALASLPVGRRRLRREWGILHARNRKLSFPENVFVDLCRNVAKELMMEKGD
jgi:LysR family transcriptional regulator, low CO2-responsive transcriptional regulator